MARRGGRKIKRRLRCGFTLVEVLVACALLASIGGGTLFAGASLYDQLSDTSDYSARREAAEAVAWLRGLFHDARVLREDFTLVASGYSGPFPTLTVLRRTADGHEYEHWVGRNIAFSVEMESGTPAAAHTYDHMFQTMSPAFTLNVHKKKKDGKYEFSGRTITISVHGAVNLKGEK
jgi:prepilin-type N-terminal cleavage/methylation domain-containing protein